MLARDSYASSIDPPLLRENDRLQSLALALDEISEGVVFMNCEGRLIWHNQAFDKLLTENSEGHLLVASVIELAADFHQQLFGEHGRHSGDPDLRTIARSVNVGRLDHEIACTLMPEGMLGPESHLICLIRRSASRWTNYGERLRRTWGLTEREAQVAVECLRGKKNLEIAEQLRISVETVNKHLDKVYQKAAVRGRSELAYRLLDGDF
jgi:DNA-binding CsgD family transcriptional regulator